MTTVVQDGRGTKPDVKLVEVGPRDGLQNEADWVPTSTKLGFIERLVSAGLAEIEVTSFVSPKKIPQLADATELVAQLVKREGTTFSALVPNLQGLNRALQGGIRAVSVFASASEAFSRQNINCSIDESLDRFAPVIASAREQQVPVRAYISCALGCPYSGAVAPDAVAQLALRLSALGCGEISLSDTIGVGTPFAVRRMISAVADLVPIDHLAGHFHDTYGQAIANIYASLDLGVRIFDASTAGLGGCPFAPGSSGNVATEDVVYLLEGLGLTTGVDLDKLLLADKYITLSLRRETGSKVARARSRHVAPSIGQPRPFFTC